MLCCRFCCEPCVLCAGLKETTEQLVKKKLEEKDKLTPWEEFLEKKKDKKKQKKSQRKQVGRCRKSGPNM